jgi:hypothetical protein
MIKHYEKYNTSSWEKYTATWYDILHNQSINQSHNEYKIELLTDLLALHKIRRKVDTTHT